jgi:glycosyltransferase involved in cell wall biosynthesis
MNKYRNKIKILISAYTCEPGKGSEAGIGWNWIIEHIKYHQVYVITRENNEKVIFDQSSREVANKVNWIFFDLPYWLRFWKRGAKGARLYYYLWQIGAFFKIKKLNKNIKFDLIHHVTFGTYWLPSFLCLLPIPFIWGPVGGGESAPRFLYKTLSRRGKIFEIKRDFVRFLVRYGPFLRLTAKKSLIILATSVQTLEKIQELGAKNIKLMSNVALPDEDIKKLINLPIRNNNKFIFLSIGRLLHWKGLHLSIEAYSTIIKEIGPSEYWIIGDGPERQNLQKIAEKLGVSNFIRFYGKVERKKVFEIISESNVLLHPSLHDSGGWVCAEAMAAGKPVICLDIGGPALQVTKETGIKVRVEDTKQIIHDMARGMIALYKHPEIYKNMSIAGRKRIVSSFRWESRGQKIKEIIKEII